MNKTDLTPEFWKTKTLSEMTPEEWEALCDRCGQCCLIKLQNDDTEAIAVTKLACKLLDLGTCRCSQYANRQDYVADCISLKPHDVETLPWLPPTCGYRLVAEGKPLSWWHPLISQSFDTVHEAGISVRNKAISETKVPTNRHMFHIAYWLDPKSDLEP